MRRNSRLGHVKEDRRFRQRVSMSTTSGPTRKRRHTDITTNDKLPVFRKQGQISQNQSMENGEANSTRTCSVTLPQHAGVQTPDVRKSDWQPLV